MTATPPRADLRTLAAEGDAPMTDQAEPSPQSLCDHPVYVHHVRGGEPLIVPICQLCGEIGWDDLREQMAEHRRMVLTEAADEVWAELRRIRLDARRRAAVSIEYINGWEDATGHLERLAATAPPAGLSATVPAGNALAVPEEADGQRAGESDPLDPPMDDLDEPGRRAAAAQGAIDCIGERHTIPWEQISESVADVQPLIAQLRETRAELADADRRRAEFEERVSAQVEDLRADRDRLAAQVAQCQRVVEKAQAWRAARPGPWVSGTDVEFQLFAAVDALPGTGPHQHECACNRNWGGPCGPCVCEEPPRQGVWRLVCGAENIPPNQTYATKGAAEDVMRLHDGACPGTHGVEFVPDAGTDQTEDGHG